MKPCQSCGMLCNDHKTKCPFCSTKLEPIDIVLYRNERLLNKFIARMKNMRRRIASSLTRDEKHRLDDEIRVIQSILFPYSKS